MKRLVDNLARGFVALTVGGFLLLALRNNCAPAAPGPEEQAPCGVPSLYLSRAPGEPALEQALLEQLAGTTLLGESDPFVDYPRWRRARRRQGHALIFESFAGSLESESPAASATESLELRSEKSPAAAALRVFDLCTGALEGLSPPAVLEGSPAARAAALRSALLVPPPSNAPVLALGDLQLEESLPPRLREELLWALRERVLRVGRYRWVEPREIVALFERGPQPLVVAAPQRTLFIIVQGTPGNLFGRIEVRDAGGTEVQAKLPIHGATASEFFGGLPELLDSADQFPSPAKTD